MQLRHISQRNPLPKFLFLIIPLLFVGWETGAQSNPSPYQVPPQFREDFGCLRSPLLFDDGTEVKTAEDWQRRRKEILKYWTNQLGEWPPLITEPKVEILETTKRDGGIQQHTIRFHWTPVEKTTGYLLIPEGSRNRPAVLTVYYEPETSAGLKREYRDFAWQLAKSGFVTLSVGSTETTNARTYATYFPHIEHATVQPLSILGYAAANCWHVLAQRPEVDARRIGIVGHSYGGKWSMFAGALFDKFAAVAVSDPGIMFSHGETIRPSINYWEPWYLGWHPQPWRKRGLPSESNPIHGAYPQLLQDGRDLHEIHALIAPRPFFVSGGSEDPPERWKALNHLVRINQLLGKEGRVGMTNRPQHAPNPQSNAAIYAFFEKFLGPVELKLSDEELRKRMQQVMGPFPNNERRVKLDLKVEKESDQGSYIRKLITYQSEPGSRTPAWLCIPKLKAGDKAPAVLCLHPTDAKVGHDVVVGLTEKPNRHYAAELAERGYVTLSPAYPQLANYWPNLGKLGYVSGTMKAIWDNSRALDLLDSFDFVDASNGYGAIGHSLGGHNAIYSAIFDCRITVICSSCGFDAYPDYYRGNERRWEFGQGWSQTRYMPRLSNYRGKLKEIPFDFPHMLTSLASRNIYINAPLHDSNFQWQSVDDCVDYVRRNYGKLADNIIVEHPVYGHDFQKPQREAAYRTMDKVLQK